MNFLFQLFIVIASILNTNAHSFQIGGGGGTCRAACIANCQLLNCESGFCTGINSGVCVCVDCTDRRSSWFSWLW